MSRKKIFPLFLPFAGCPSRCIYCAQNLTGGGSLSLEPVPTLAYLQPILSLKGECELAFYGGSFTLLPEKEQDAWLKIGAELIRDRRVSSLRISTRPDAVSVETVQRLADAGVETVELGCQSFDDIVLSAAGRGHDAATAAAAVTLLRSHGIAVGIHLMPGLPAADDGEALRSLQTALSLGPDFLRIHPTLVLKGTELERLYRTGAYTPLTLPAAVQLCAEIYRVSHAAGVPVIRFGLQGNEELDGGEAVVAGPYHPAFGQLVRSRLWLELVSRLAANECRTFQLHPADLSDLLGQRRSNIHELQQQFGQLTCECSPSVPRESIKSGGKLYPLFS